MRGFQVSAWTEACSNSFQPGAANILYRGEPMRSKHSVFVALVAILLLSVEAFAAPPATQPATPLRLATPADLKEMHDAGEYRTCLQQIAHILSLSPQVTRA